VIVGLKEFIISKPGQFHDKIVAKGKREGAMLTYQSIFLSKQKHQEREEEEVLYNNTHMYTVCCDFFFNIVSSFILFYQNFTLCNLKNNNNCACSKRAQLEWEAAEEARLLAERKARKKAKKEEKKRANFKERAQLLGVKITVTH
jgi:hypothetical protein